MKAARLSMLAIPLMVGVAFAQTTGSSGQSQGSKGQSSSGQSSSQSDRQAGSQSGAGSGSQSGAASGSQSGTMAGSESGKPAELKTMTYKGTLVDLSCSGGAQGSATAATTTPSTTGGAAGTAAGSATTAGSTAASAANTANRSTGGDMSSCPATANSSQLGLKMDDGKTVRFDLVGNQRAQDELKNNKGWSKALSANKPLKVKISGVMQGDKLIVSSIH